MKKGFKHSEETKRRLSEVNKGKKHSKEAREKISKALKKRIYSEEQRRKLSERSKGNKYCLGRKHSEETKKKISDAHKGMKASVEAKRNMSKARKGKKISEEHKRKISISSKLSKNSGRFVKGDSRYLVGNKMWAGKKHTKEAKRKIIEALKKRVCSEETKAKLRSRKGEKSPNWKGGVSPVNTRIRMSVRYAEWRKAVFERDKYICVSCGSHGGQLNADHIKRFATYPELRFDLKNGRTLCVPCHKKTDTFGNKKQKHDRSTIHI